MLTSLRTKHMFQSTLHNKFKTHPGVLPQLQALEDSSADTPGQARNGANPNAGMQHWRGETAERQRYQRSQRRSACGASRVFVLDKRGKPMNPCKSVRARILLDRGRAVVVNMYPFTIRLKDRLAEDTQQVDLKIDPGAKTTGMALVRADGEVLFQAEIEHRGRYVRKRMEQRSNYRRRRRSANLRYRAPRFLNRRSGRKLTPSLRSRVDNVLSWTDRFRMISPITRIQCESVRFDTQVIDNPDIQGIAYQQGTLAGYEVREYLLEKWGRTCAYCDKTDVPLQLEHIQPKASGGSNRISNLTLSCAKCNQKKGAMPVEQFLMNNPERLRKILAGAKKPLSDAAAVNVTRRFIFEGLMRTGLPVFGASGGRTKFNRARQGIPKTHALDAACVGETPRLRGWNQSVLKIKAMGRGSYQRTRVNRYGFPRGHLMKQKSVKGFQTGNIVKSVIPSGKLQGVHVGRVAVRASGYFNIQRKGYAIQGVSYQYCRTLKRANGYSYQIIERPTFLLALNGGIPVR